MPAWPAWASRRCCVSDDLRLGYLPDCEGPAARRHAAVPCSRNSRISQSFRHRSRRALGLLVAGRVHRSRRAPASRPRRPHRQLPQVTAAAAVARDVTEWDEFTGRLEAVQSVGVRPRVSGLISSVSFEEGSLVRQGQVLFQLDDRPFQAQVATAARRAGAGDAPRAIAPPPNCGAPIGCRPRTRCRSRSASAAPAPPPKRPRTSTPSPPRCAPPSSISSSPGSSRRSTAASAARSSRAAISSRAARAKRRCSRRSSPSIRSTPRSTPTSRRSCATATASASTARGPRAAICRFRWRWPTNRPFRTRARCSSSTTSSIRRPARSTAARSSATPIAA